MEASKAATTIQAHVDPTKPLTVADASAATGLALRDADSGLKWLSTEYRGRLRVTSEGQLVHLFPTGFTKPWAAHDARQRVVSAASHALASAVRFVVRAWVAVVLVGYAAIFISLLLAMTFARQGNDSSATRSSGRFTLGRRFRSTAAMAGHGTAGGWATRPREPGRANRASLSTSA
jgi:hypothetical protein